MFKDPTHGHRCFSAGMHELLGLSRTGKLPKEGMPSRLIDGILVWVVPAAEPATTIRYGRPRLLKRSTHRVMCRCPDCGQTLSVGRWGQHVCPDDRPLHRLQQRARKAAAKRGHYLGTWQPGSIATCLHKGCGAWVQCIVTPLPNEIDIGGPAVAIGCVPQFPNR